MKKTRSSTSHRTNAKWLFYATIFIFLIISTAGRTQSVHTKQNEISLDSFQIDIGSVLWSYNKNKFPIEGKRPIGLESIANWKGIGEYFEVSNSGNYFAYSIEKSIGVRYHKKIDSIIIRSRISNYRKSIFSEATGQFTADSHYYILLTGKSLEIENLKLNETKSIQNVAAISVADIAHKSVIAYQCKDSSAILHWIGEGKQIKYTATLQFGFIGDVFYCSQQDKLKPNSSKRLILYDIKNGTEVQFTDIKSFKFSANKKTVVVEQNADNSTKRYKLTYRDLYNGTEKRIWDASKLISYSLDYTGKQVVMVTQRSHPSNYKYQGPTEFWYYKSGMKSAELKFTSDTTYQSTAEPIAYDATFTEDGGLIIITFSKRDIPPPNNRNIPRLELWSYKDTMLQSAQAIQKKKLNEAVILVDPLSNRKAQPESNQIISTTAGEYVILKEKAASIYGDRFWENGYGYHCDFNWLINVKDGTKTLLPTRGGDYTFWFTPNRKYLVYFDPHRQCHYFAINLKTGKINNISKNVPNGQFGLIDDHIITDAPSIHPVGIAAWLKNENTVLVYDNYNLWLLDLDGIELAINITKTIENEKEVVFNPLTCHRFQNEIPTLSRTDLRILRGYNRNTKSLTFYRLDKIGDTSPTPLSVHNYFFNLIPWFHDPNLSNKGLPLVRLKGSNVWIAQRQSINDAPNYYETSDFVHFKKLTDFQPQRGFMWMKEELHTFNHLTGRKGQGILYMPENFNPNLKYSVIIVFYGDYSANLNQFHPPSFNYTSVTPGTSPAWYVANNFLVFVPDIYVSPLEYGPQALNVIEGAANFLKQQKYIDSNRIGICSHSWSAKLGSYIFTHSNSFKATSISEGFLYANMLNVALSIDEAGKSNMEVVENGFKYGNLWTHKQKWLDQTTILNLDRSNSPLLLYCNKNSSTEYQDQTIQLFTSLRRLEKPVWWLRYDKEGHTLTEINDQIDYTIRATQFFDHYLNNAPPPSWMTEGIPNKQKGYNLKYELDPHGNCSDRCETCKYWNLKFREDRDIQR